MWILKELYFEESKTSVKQNLLYASTVSKISVMMKSNEHRRQRACYRVLLFTGKQIFYSR